MRHARALILAAAVLCAAAPLHAKTTAYLARQRALFDQALAEMRLAPEQVRIDAGDVSLWGGGKYRRAILDLYFANPWKISAYTRVQTDNLLEQHEEMARLVFEAHKLTDAGVRLGLIGNPLARYRQRIDLLGGEALARALGELTGRKAESFMTADYGQVPEQVREAAALVLLVVPAVQRYRQLALLDPLRELRIDPNDAYARVWDYAIEGWDEVNAKGNEDPQEARTLEVMLDAVDWPVLNTGATLLAQAVEQARRQLSDPEAEIPPGIYRFSADTPLGRVVLSGGTDDSYRPENYLLILDTSGHDFYESAGATRGPWQGVSVCIDLAGYDIYHNPSSDVAAFGAGVFGYGILVDQEGNDEYECPFVGEGAGLFGTGVLWDLAGDDRYRGTSHLQGCGVFGTGLLIDNAGDDRYDIYQYGQGYGYTLGCGLLLESQGNDEYYAEKVDRPNGGPFGADHHIHFVQGAALGRRADYIDGHSWAGGVGLLVDGAGHDRYTCDVYGQGTGYWYGTGICVDKEGDDVHDAGWYALGSAPHFAVGIFQDDAGEDRYVGTIQQCLGNGRDWSIGWFEDSAGNDWYQAGVMTLGTGDLNGIGVFWDKEGDDAYLTKGPTLGQSRMEQAGTVRDAMLTLGLFVDGGGEDRYVRLPGSAQPSGQYIGEIAQIDSLVILDFAGNGKTWKRPTDRNRVPGAYGAGLDAQ